MIDNGLDRLGIATHFTGALDATPGKKPAAKGGRAAAVR